MFGDEIGVVGGVNGPVVRNEPGELAGDGGDIFAEEWQAGRDLSRPGYFVTDHLTKELE